MESFVTTQQFGGYQVGDPITDLEEISAITASDLVHYVVRIEHSAGTTDPVLISCAGATNTLSFSAYGSESVNWLVVIDGISHTVTGTVPQLNDFLNGTNVVSSYLHAGDLLLTGLSAADIRLEITSDGSNPLEGKYSGDNPTYAAVANGFQACIAPPECAGVLVYQPSYFLREQFGITGNFATALDLCNAFAAGAPFLHFTGYNLDDLGQVHFYYSNGNPDGIYTGDTPIGSRSCILV